MTPCPLPEKLQGLLADRLDGAEAAALEVHVETCAGCQQALERLTGHQEGSLQPGSFRENMAGKSGGEFLRRLERMPPGAGRPAREPERRAPGGNEANDLRRHLSHGI